MIKDQLRDCFPVAEGSGTSHTVVELVSFCLTGCPVPTLPKPTLTSSWDQLASKTCFYSLLSSSYFWCLTGCRPGPRTVKSLGTVSQPPFNRIRTAQYLTPVRNLLHLQSVIQSSMIARRKRSKWTQEATVLIRSTRSTRWTTMEGWSET